MLQSLFIVDSTAYQYIVISCYLLIPLSALAVKIDNINGTFAVHKGMHYSNKTTVTWGQNGETEWGVTISLSASAGAYDCSATDCEDVSGWMYDWNKLWGKARCGYLHDHHQDSDRFVFRRCSDSSCSAYNSSGSVETIQIGAYSYDNGVAPYDPSHTAGFMKTFKTLIEPDKPYYYYMSMESNGITSFQLFDGKELLEIQTVQHENLCVDNYFEGTVDGLYFGGTCVAPIEVVAIYSS